MWMQSSKISTVCTMVFGSKLQIYNGRLQKEYSTKLLFKRNQTKKIMVKLENDGPDIHDGGFWVGILFVLMALSLMLVTSKACAQTRSRIDTVACKVECIKRFVFVPSKTTNRTKTYVIYDDAQNDISDLIPVSDSVCAYIQECAKAGIKPNLGIKLRNGQIVSIIRYKPRYIKKE